MFFLFAIVSCDKGTKNINPDNIESCSEKDYCLGVFDNNSCENPIIETVTQTLALEGYLGCEFTVSYTSYTCLLSGNDIVYFYNTKIDSYECEEYGEDLENAIGQGETALAKFAENINIKIENAIITDFMVTANNPDYLCDIFNPIPAITISFINASCYSYCAYSPKEPRKENILLRKGRCGNICCEKRTVPCINDQGEVIITPYIYKLIGEGTCDNIPYSIEAYNNCIMITECLESCE